MDKAYKTIRSPARAKIAVGACRFISSLSPCQNEREAKSFIQDVKKKFHDATHNAYAYRILSETDIIARSNDDGEPAGTAGAPMLAVLEKNELVNVVLVGTRYFGGVKLGIGGLIRAYRSCAEAGLKEVDICLKAPELQVVVEVSYDHIGVVLREAASMQAEIEGIDYREKVAVMMKLRKKSWSSFKRRLKDATSGQVTFFIK